MRSVCYQSKNVKSFMTARFSSKFYCDEHVELLKTVVSKLYQAKNHMQIKIPFSFLFFFVFRFLFLRYFYLKNVRLLNSLYNMFFYISTHHYPNNGKKKNVSILLASTVYIQT